VGLIEGVQFHRALKRQFCAEVSAHGDRGEACQK